MGDESTATMTIDIVQDTIIQDAEAVIALDNLEAAPDKVYSHTLADGREVSGTFEQIMDPKNGCILGKLSVQEAMQVIEKQDLINRTAEKGRAIREAKESANRKQEPKTETIKQESKTVEQSPKLNTTTNLYEENLQKIAHLKTIENLIRKNEMDEKLLDDDANKHSPEKNKQNEVKDKKPGKDKLMTNLTQENKVKLPLAEKSIRESGKTKHSDSEVLIAKADIPSSSTKIESDKATLGKIQEFLTTFKTEEDAPALDANEFKLSDDQEVPIETEILIENSSIKPEADIDDETMEIFNQLIELDSKIPDVSDLIEPEAATISTFEDFINSQDLPDKPISLEDIQLCADQQTIEETLVQMVSYLTSAETGNDDTESISIINNEQTVIKLLQEIEAELVKFSRVSSDEKEVHQLTPEITQKLLALLKAVGYEQPREALLDFVSGHSIEFLLQAIHYLYQLTDQDYRMEFLQNGYSAPLLMSRNDSLALRFGKLLLGLIKNNTDNAQLSTQSSNF